MANESVDSEIVSQFLLDSCRLRPQLTQHAVHAALRCAEATMMSVFDDHKEADIPLITGSVAEFYIEPMLPCIGDIDIMFHRSGYLAIPRGHPPPTQLLAEFGNYVHLSEIIDSHFPGYVYLEVRYLLTYCPEDEKYNYMEHDSGQFYSNWNAFTDEKVIRHGPAVFQDFIEDLSFDAVPCVRCLVWPPQAADWPTRHRNYGWPDSATVERVVSNG